MKRYGLVICFSIAIIATVLGHFIPVVGGIIFSIIIGIILNNLCHLPAYTQPGIQFSAKKILQYAIIVMGLTLNLRVVSALGLSSLPITLLTISAALLTSLLLGKFFGIPENIRTLIGVGTAICGGSAIAATSPIIKAKEDEVAFSLSTIFLFNIIAVFIFPVMGHFLGLSDQGYGHFAGTAINDTSSVVAAGYAYSVRAGDTATIVKLVRALMIVPVCLVILILQMKRHKKTVFNIKKVFPWFILYFILASALTTIFNIPEDIILYIKIISTFMISIAMAGIGLTVDIKKFINIGFKPVLLGGIVWCVVAALSLVLQKMFNIW
ncbi:YeiH family protein [Macrococcoides caseolyticum]|uniref:YeiH family protein n=1 Tax=Macrococcoides caseolyticum TaxID=69966 RepID=UPI001F3F9A01|nr:YeiH family protein [Macrococcus caseolyticus]MCE4957790.1 YeiH family putative sulfate export transporter [Macrococcus caseolyticus]